MNGVFVAGTDTEIGKTFVAGGIAGALGRRGVDVGAVKPVQTGCFEEDGETVAPDARFLRDAAGLDHDVCPFLLGPALAPEVAADVEGVELSYDAVVEGVERLCGRHDFTVVEGIGGVRVPLADGYEVIDLMVDLDLPVVVVARPNLGTLNHTALTVEAVERRGLDVVGVVVNRYPHDPGVVEETNPGVIESMTSVDVIGVLPDVTDADPENAVDAVEEHVDLSTVTP